MTNPTEAQVYRPEVWTPIQIATRLLDDARVTKTPRLLSIDAGPALAGWAILAPPGVKGSQARPVYVASGHALNDEVLDLVKVHPGPFAIERCFWQPKLKNGSDLLATARIEGDYRGHIRALWPNASLVELSSRDWRHQLGVGPSASNKSIHRMLDLVVEGMPTRSNEHGRDALGLAVVASRILGKGWR